MMSEARWTTVENVAFFSKQSIATKLPVKLVLKLYDIQVLTIELTGRKL